MSAVAHSIVALLQASADSVGTRITVERSWLDTFVDIGQSLVSFLVLVMLVMAVGVLWAVKKSIQELTKLIKSVYEPVASAATETRDAARELLQLTKSTRGHVDKFGGTLGAANDRLHAAVAKAEHRFKRMDALVGVVQDEAEHLVVSAASAARGVEAGGAMIGRFLGLAAGEGGPRRRTTVREGSIARVAGVPAASGEAADDEMTLAVIADVPSERPRIRARDHRPS